MNHWKYKSLMMAGVVFGLLSACQADNQTTVHLKGRILNMTGSTKVLKYDGAASVLGNGKDIVLNLDANGCFDTIIPLQKPAYYSIGRNTLYLTPGDDLTMAIASSNTMAQFTGKGAEVNEYMKGRLFPKAGSYLHGGANVKEDFASTFHFIDSLAAGRRAQLMALKDAGDVFKRLEEARIDADLLISYYYYPIYANIQAQVQRKPELAMLGNAVDSFYVAVSDRVRPLVERLNQEAFLDVAAVRSALDMVMGNGRLASWQEGIVFDPTVQELAEAVEWADKLSGHISKATLDKAAAFVGTMKNREYAQELSVGIEKASKLMDGQTIDFSFTDSGGKSCRLSDFKGKVLYLDFWATWCGPCTKESPYFEALAKEYEGKDVVFLAISTDEDRKAWENYLKAHPKDLPQYHSKDEALKAGWNIKYIPRFVLIDKDFKLADAYAPRPSDERIREMLDKLLE